MNKNIWGWQKIFSSVCSQLSRASVSVKCPHGPVVPCLNVSGDDNMLHADNTVTIVQVAGENWQIVTKGRVSPQLQILLLSSSLDIGTRNELRNVPRWRSRPKCQKVFAQRTKDHLWVVLKEWSGHNYPVSEMRNWTGDMCSGALVPMLLCRCVQ